MHVISASRRTDIPAFYAEWFMNRIRAGRVGVRAPFGGRSFEISLIPDDVIAVMFWTKNAGPLLTRFDELTRQGYDFGFLYTVNNYPESLEPHVPDLRKTIETISGIASRYSPQIIRWRYDTIVLSDVITPEWHVENFTKLCDTLAPYTDECIFSFCDYYKKTVRNMEQFVPSYRIPDEIESKELAEKLGEIACEHGIRFASCAHDFLLSDHVHKAACIDFKFLSRIVKDERKLAAAAKLKPAPTRKECGCLASRDIGAYDTCVHGCFYCYANANFNAAKKNYEMIQDDDYSLDRKLAGTAKIESNH
jgi:hypothetical protein